MTGPAAPRHSSVPSTSARGARPPATSSRAGYQDHLRLSSPARQQRVMGRGSKARPGRGGSRPLALQARHKGGSRKEENAPPPGPAASRPGPRRRSALTVGRHGPARGRWAAAAAGYPAPSPAGRALLARPRALGGRPRTAPPAARPAAASSPPPPAPRPPAPASGLPRSSPKNKKCRTWKHAPGHARGAWPGSPLQATFPTILPVTFSFSCHLFQLPLHPCLELPTCSSGPRVSAQPQLEGTKQAKS